MKDFNEVCGGKTRCISPIVIACNCGNPVIFFCQDCATQHFLEPRPHLFLQLDQARQLFLQPQPSQRYTEIYGKSARIKTEIERYIIKLLDFKARILSIKQEIYQDLEESVDINVQKIDFLLNHTYDKLEDLNKWTNEIESFDQEFIKKYESRGIKGIIDNYLDILSLNYHDIKQAIRQMITIDRYPTSSSINSLQISEGISPQTLEIPTVDQSQTNIVLFPLPIDIVQPQTSTDEFQPSIDNSEPSIPESHSLPISLSKDSNLHSRCIFSTKNGTKDLIKYDTDFNTLTSYSLSNLTHSFYFSSVCTLPDGSILISGGQTVNSFFQTTHGYTYRVDLATSPPLITQLGDLNFPRSNSRLICHRDYIYNFGGCDEFSLNKAERMRIGDDFWEVLPNMKEPREDFGIHITVNRIYCIGGFSNTTVEYFDIRLHSFRRFVKVEVPTGGIVCGIIDKKIYTVGKNQIRVYSRSFKLMESRKVRNNRHTYCYSDGVVIEGCLVYIDSQNMKVWKSDSRKRNVKILKEI